MNPYDLPLNTLYAVGFGLFLSCLVSLFYTVRTFGHPSVKRIFRLCLLCAFADYLHLSAWFHCFFLIRRGEMEPDKGMFALFISSVVCGSVTFVAVAVMSLSTERRIRRELSAQSIREGLDQLPEGICYSLPDGFPKLVNDQMQRISNAAFGAGVVDANKLRDRLANHELQPGCKVDERDGNLFLCLPDGSVRQMVEGAATVDGRELTEMIAFDVTDRYRDLLELEERNKHLEEVNRQIREYDRRMDRIIREKEILAAKIRVHSSLGQCLLSIQSYLKYVDDSRETVTRELAKTVALMRNNTVEEHSDDRLYALFEAAETVGVRIRIDGEIPPRHKEIIEIAIHECLTNAVKHADGHLLVVKIRQKDHVVSAELSNDGKPPKGPITETGGLKNLRALVERQGGEMILAYKPVFRLTLRMICIGGDEL